VSIIGRAKKSKAAVVEGRAPQRWIRDAEWTGGEERMDGDGKG
jgi:hypothetical protein